MLPMLLARIRSLYPYKNDFYPEEPMQALFATVTNAAHLNSLVNVLSCVSAATNTLEKLYEEDGNSKDVAIDALCQLLQQHKTPKA